MNQLLFKKEENQLTISIGKTSHTLDLTDVKVNNDELAEFLTDLSSYFMAEEFSYYVVPEEAINDDKVKLFIKLIEEFINTFKKEFTNLKQQYSNEIKNLKTKINE